MLTVILEQQDTNTSLNRHKVMAWLSPSYPIGSFAYSHGLEFEIASGNITEKQEVKQWVEDLLKFGSGWNELVLFSLAYKSDMVYNNLCPNIEVDPETYEVRADGSLLTCEPASELPMAQRYFLY